MGNSGGAAAHGGTNFQQRVSALAAAYSLTGFKNYTAFGLNGENELLEIRHETDNFIDDFILIFQSARVLVQAKRSISFSSRTGSIFSEVVKQFVKQYISDNNFGDIYLLATTPSASQKVTEEIKKLTESARLNEKFDEKNPLTKSEKETLKGLRFLICEHYKKFSGVSPRDEDIYEIFKRIHVTKFDIESGSSGETSIVFLLGGALVSSPLLFWNALIEFSATLAKDRQSIGENSLREKLKHHFKSNDKESSTHDRSKKISTELRGALRSGREVVVVKSDHDSADYLLIEFYRFDASGKRRIKFSKNTVELQNGVKYDLLYRASTFAGAERFLAENPAVFATSRCAVIPINGDSAQYDNSSFSLLHAEHCARLLESREDILECIYCGDKIATNSSPLVEIDEIGIPETVGLIHKECHHPSYRVLGLMQNDFLSEYPLLHNFDFLNWYEKISAGVNIFLSTAHIKNQIIKVLWNPDHSKVTHGQWCVRIDFEDGSAKYVTERWKVQRYSESRAFIIAEELNQSYRKSRTDRDPWSYSKKSGAYGPYSSLLKIIETGEKITKCVSATPASFSKAIDTAYSATYDYYAPLIYLLNRETKEPLIFSEAIFLLSNPLDIESFVTNWELAEFELPPFSVATISSDAEFNDFLRKSFREKIYIFVDPLFDSSQTIVRGFHIEDMSGLVKKFSNDS